jgi:hypothetical protein
MHITVLYYIIFNLCFAQLLLNTLSLLFLLTGKAFSASTAGETAKTPAQWMLRSRGQFELSAADIRSTAFQHLLIGLKLVDY